jgi:hypothetical protein
MLIFDFINNPPLLHCIEKMQRISEKEMVLFQETRFRHITRANEWFTAWALGDKVTSIICHNSIHYTLVLQSDDKCPNY